MNKNLLEVSRTLASTNPRTKNVIRYHTGPTKNPPPHLKVSTSLAYSPIYLNYLHLWLSLFCKTIKPFETASMLEYGIWGKLNLCFQAMVSHNDFRINYLLFSSRWELWLLGLQTQTPWDRKWGILCWQTLYPLSSSPFLFSTSPQHVFHSLSFHWSILLRTLSDPLTQRREKNGLLGRTQADSENKTLNRRKGEWWVCEDVKADSLTTRDIQQSALILGSFHVYTVMCFQFCPWYSSC